MSEVAFSKTVCMSCGVHVEYPTEAAGQTAPCPKCGANVFLHGNEIQETAPRGNVAPEWKVPHFVVQPRDANITEGDFMFFKAKAKGFPNPSYQWFKVDLDGRWLALQGETKPELALSTAPLGISHYAVRATNSAGNSQSRVASLLVRANLQRHQSQIDSGAGAKPIPDHDNLLLGEDIEIQRRQLQAEKSQAIFDSHAKANQTGILIGRVLIGIVAGIIGAVGIGLACLLAGKMGWNGLGSFLATWRFRILDLGVWMLAIPAFIPIWVFFKKPKTQTFRDAIKNEAVVNCSTIALLSCFLLTFSLFYSPSQPVQPASTSAASPIEDLKSKAERGDADAQLKLGDCYLNGKSGAKDEVEAVKWFRMAADQNNFEAQHRLGICYEFGLGVPKDYFESVDWYRKAAQQNYPPAQFVLGYCYENGQGVAPDNWEAARWYRKAAEQNHTEAQFRLGLCYTKGKGVIKDDNEARKWFHLAADKNYAEAQLHLGYNYEFGHGAAFDDSDDAEAAKWYRKAADQGNAEAKNVLGNCYFGGHGVAQDQREAYKWWKSAAEQYNAAAQYNLGDCYENGRGVVKDDAEAVKWYLKAAYQDHNEAINRVGKLYLYGELGVEKNLATAKSWFEISAKNGDAGGQASLQNLNESGAPTYSQLATSVPANPPKAPQVTTINVSAKVTEANESYWKWAWKMTLVNRNAYPVEVKATIQFFDRDGYAVAEDTYGLYDIKLNANSSQNFAGAKLVRLPAARNVASVGAKVEFP